MILSDVVARLAGRKGKTEADIQADVRAVLLDGALDLEAGDITEVNLEAQVGAGKRIDVEAGTTAIEVKKDLSSATARKKAAEQLAGYLKSREEETGQRWAGILTDGVLWELYHLTSGGIEAVTSLRLRGSADDAENLAVWLEGVLATAQGIQPTALEIQRRLGAESSSFALDYADLLEIYEQHKDDKEIQLKRELWARLLASALGTHFEDTDELFVLHTYLVVSAELIAHATVGLPIVGQVPASLLSGDVFRSVQIGGVVEADFFDWPAEPESGRRFVQALARRIARFDWSEVDHDVLKVLYESVIDAETRKQLGEYYTPDWLAEGIVETVVTDPLNERVLDPACGSGTFLFWAVRRYLEAADADGMSVEDAIKGAVSHVAGIDLHPVAVALARVTYLLAIGTDRLQERPAFSVPVYLGDSLRWEEPDKTLFAKGGITIFTTDGVELFDRELHFPERVVADVVQFDQLVSELATKASRRERGSAVPKIGAILSRLAVHPDDREAVEAAFKVLCDLHDQGRNHIWGYYIRNQARPLWFTRPENRVDVLVGNPPWLAYRWMSDEMQETYKSLSQDRDMWAGGNVSTHQDLSDLFVERAVEQYLRGAGQFGFVMPAAVLSRRQYEGFRTGNYEVPDSPTAIAFDTPWDLREVRPDIFPVPASVIFGERAGAAVPLPSTAKAFIGRISPRGTRWSDAKASLTEKPVDIERGSDDDLASSYKERFFQGATILPRVLLTVEPKPAGPLGAPKGTRSVVSRRTRLENAPWKDLDTLEGLIEEQFVYPCYVGESITPFRAIECIEAVIPRANGQLLGGQDIGIDQYPHLASWMRDAEELWESHKGEKNKLTLLERLDYHKELSKQFPLQQDRVIYSKSGNRITACRISDPNAVVDHTAYWATMTSVDEGRYLTGIFNSLAVHKKVEPLMSEGLYGKRHIDKYVFAVPFPLFDPGDELHQKLVKAAAHAETVAEEVDLGDAGFQKARSLIRDALAKDGVAQTIEELVEELLAGVELPTVS